MPQGQGSKLQYLWYYCAEDKVIVQCTRLQHYYQTTLKPIIINYRNTEHSQVDKLCKSQNKSTIIAASMINPNISYVCIYTQL